MSENDATREFLQSLPEVDPATPFSFACHPDVGCFNACCGDLNLLLTPYDVLRLCRGLQMPSADFLSTHCEISLYPDTGFPAIHLRMEDNEYRNCPFVTEAGCSVYENRPAACRTYPLGRVVRTTEDGGIKVQYYLVQEAHCQGFKEPKSWLLKEWIADQGLQLYFAAGDRYSLLLARQKASGNMVPQNQAGLLVLSLYQQDKFLEFMENTGLLDRLEMDRQRRETVLDDEEARLEFAMDWLELVLFGESTGLIRKK